MSTCKGAWKLQDVRDQILAGKWIQYDKTNDPGTLWAWGGNGDGNLGLGDIVDRSVPVQIPGTDWSIISTGRQNYAAAIKGDGTLWTWGAATGGILGNNTNAGPKSSPIQVPGTQWSNITSSRIHMATKTDGTLWSWGYNTVGQLGNNSTINASSPTQVPGTSWNDIASGDSHSAARKTDGTLWVWGSDGSGRLGKNTINVPASSPIQIPGTLWSDVSFGYLNSLALKADGTLWAWGAGTYGNNGDGTVTSRSSPIQVPGTSWNDISAVGTSGAGGFSLARKSDGTMWSWGCNRLGHLGDNSTSNRNSPVQIPGTQWSCVARGGYQNAMATKTDGTLWAWGSAYDNILGDGIKVHRSSPIQVPGTCWYKPTSSRSNFAIKIS